MHTDSRVGMRTRGFVALTVLGAAGLVGCNADRTGTIGGGALPAVSISIDGCSPTNGSNTVTWSGLPSAIASVQLVYGEGSTVAPTAWANLKTATAAGTSNVSVPAEAKTGTWVVLKAVLATKKNGLGVLTERAFDCVVPSVDTTKPTVSTEVLPTVNTNP